MRWMPPAYPEEPHARSYTPPPFHPVFPATVAGRVGKIDGNDPVLVDRLKIVDFPKLRYIKKIGESLYTDTEYSGKAFIMEVNKPKVRQGFLETSNVNPVIEMVNLIEVHRNYEANQKMIQAHDTALARLINDVGKV